MKDIYREPSEEYNAPTFSVNLYDEDGDAYEKGIYLHYQDTIIRVASSLKGFKAHTAALIQMADEIPEHL